MKKAILFSLLFLFVIFNWSLDPSVKQAEATVTSVYLISPPDSTKMTIVKPTFTWGVIRDQGLREIPKKYHIIVDTVLIKDTGSTSPIWQDSTLTTTSVVYGGPSFVQWKTYYWSVRVQVDSIRSIDNTKTPPETTFVTLWYKFVRPFIFFYTKATLIGIPDSLPTIQKGIIWAAARDTVLVKPGIYYENLIFNKKGVILASYFARNKSLGTIDSTIIDGDSLTRGQDRGSVIYFTSNADSNSKVIGFTIRNGKGTKADVGAVKKTNGGGIYCEPNSTPTITNNVITQNQVPDDGGGVFIYSAAPNLFNNIITQNSAGGSGGAIQCFYYIKTKASGSLSPPGWEGEENGETEMMQKTNPTSPSSELNSKTNQDDLDNSLYPRDATESSPVISSDPLGKLALDNPPVAILNYYVRRDTLIQREKILVGDTIILDGSASYDPDGDPITRYRWNGQKSQYCENPNNWTNWIITSATTLDSVEVPVTDDMGGLYRVWLIVESKSPDGPVERDTSEIVYLNIQLPPSVHVAKDTVIAPGDTGWLDGSGTCDINPDDDTTLSFLWTRVSGPGSVTIVHPESVKAYFIPDASQGGIQIFQLKVSDSDTFVLDTQTVYVDRFPTAVTLDSLAGFPATIETLITRIDTLGHTIVKDTIVPTPLPLDASLSFDPDSALGDTVKYFIWKGISYTTCTGTLKFNISSPLDSSKKVQSFPASEGGGIYKVSLYVRDKYGVASQKPDTLVISVELRPTANAGPDTIIRPNTFGYLHGSACELNWDQVNSLRYEWEQDPITRSIDSLSYFPASTPNVKFQTQFSGIYRFSLRVTDILGESSRPDDTVKVIINNLPKIDSVTMVPDTTKVKLAEGDSVTLRVWAHDDTLDVMYFGDSLTYKWTPTVWPQNSDKPTVINSTNKIAKFVPLKSGLYQFQVVAHDTISPKQNPSVNDTFNLRTVKINVGYTFAYPIIRGNLISSNTAGWKGGGIDCFQSSPQIINNIFYNNKSSSSGGAICLRTIPSATSIERSAPYVNRNIFFGNVSGDSTGGAIANLIGELSPSASIGLSVKPVITYNDFWNNPGKNFYQPPADTFNNIYLYPRLIDPQYGNFRLECSSPCLHDSIGSLRWLYPHLCDTLPAPGMFSLSLFQNPVATAVAYFLVNTDVPLKAPPSAYVTIGEHSPAPVYFTYISSTTYQGRFVFTNSGTAHISVFASSVQEVLDTLTKDFSVQLIGAGKIGKLVSHDNRLAVLFPPDASKSEIYATCISVSDDPQYHFESEDKVTLGEAYHLGPLIDFKKDLTISFPLDGYDLTERDKTLFSIYRYEKNGWEKQVSYLDENSICAKITSLGVYRLVYDANQEHLTGIPKTYQLSQNYPNPFNPQTMIKYDLPNPDNVNITVYNILGQKVKTLIDEYQEAGYKQVSWDGRDDGGREVASGIYFYKIKTIGFEKTKKMVLLK
jgi:hypothetical protein